MWLSQRYAQGIQQQEITPSHTVPAYDIIVVGLGTAGSLAAITAAEGGMRVLGIERLTCMGGTGTAGSVLGYYFGSRGGLFERIDQEVLRLEARGDYTPTTGISAELKKLVLERRALAAGVELCYESVTIGVFHDEHTVKGIRWLGPEGVREARATVVIDCTGDAELCAHLDLPMRRGRASDAQAQPISNVLTSIWKNRIIFHYTDSGYVQQDDAWDFSRAIIASALLPTHLKSHYDDNLKWLQVAAQLGVREGRFIEGEESITFADYIQGRWTPEPLFYAYSNLDNHSKDIAFESTLQQDWSVVGSLWGLNFAVPIPAGTLIPRGWHGLLVAGRCLSIDHDMAACVRMKRDMQKCGEAAGLLATLAVQLGVTPKAVPYTRLKAQLTQTGCLQEHVALLKESTSHNDEENRRTAWLIEPERIQQGLSSVKPGMAIWSATRLSERMRPHLKQWLQQEQDIHLRKHSAFALGLMLDKDAIPVLLAMVRERDPFVSQTSRKYNSIRGYTAIYLLGRLQAVEALEELLTIVQQPAAFNTCPTDSEFITTGTEYFFQYFSFSMQALFSIGDAYPHHRDRIIAGLQAALALPDMTLLITLKSGNGLTYDLTDRIRTILQDKKTAWK